MSGRFPCILVAVAALHVSLGAQNRASERFQLAVGLIDRGMHDDAAKQLERFLEEQPQHANRDEAQYRLGCCYLKLDKPAKAVAALRAALGGGAGFELRAECRYRLGHTLQQTGDPTGAAEQFGKLVSEEGDKHYLAAASLYARGEALRGANPKDVAGALAAYVRAAALDRDKGGQFAVPALYQAGFLELGAGRPEQAAVHFSAAADRFPKHSAHGECRFLAGEALLRAGKVEAAEKAFGQALQAAGEFADDAALGLGFCAVRAGQGEIAAQRFRAVVERFPKSKLVPRAMLEAGRVLYKGKNAQAAYDQLDPLLARGDLTADVRVAALELRGLAALDLGRAKDAVRDLTAAAASAGKADSGRIRYSLGEAHSDAGDWAAALDAYQRSFADTPADTGKARRGDALYGQCLALHKLCRYRDSNAAADTFLRDFADHRLAVTARFARGENCFALGDYKAADAAYGAIDPKQPLYPKAAFKRAWCAYLQGDHKTASERFAVAAGLTGEENKPLAEEALSMQALAALEAELWVPALQVADRYVAAYPQGLHLARTERVAARVLKHQGKLKLAASRLARAAAAEKSTERAAGDRLEFAEVLFKQGDFAAASKAYAELAGDAGSVGGRAHEGLAWCAFELGNDDECIQWIDRGLRHKAFDKGAAGRAGLLELRAALHHRRKDWAAAAQAGQQFLDEFPKHARAAEVRYGLGVAQARAGKLAEARRTLESLRGATLQRPDRALYELAWVCRRAKDEPAALVAFAAAAQISKDDDLGGEARLHVGEALLAKKDAAAALKVLDQVKGKYTGRAQYLCGFTQFEAGKHAAALPHFDRVVALGADHPLYFEAQFFAGECEFRGARFDKAAARYSVVLDKAAEHERAQPARLHDGEALVRVGRPQQAAAVLQEYLRRAVQLKPAEQNKTEMARAWLWLGRAGQGQKDFERAEQAFAKVTELTDTELAAEAQFRVGECRRARGKLSDAVDAFVKLSILYGHAAWVQQGLDAAGDCYIALKNPKKAEKLFAELLRRFPGSPLEKQVKSKLESIRSN